MILEQITCTQELFPSPNIIQVQLSFNNTFVLLVQNSENQSVIFHMTSKGSIIQLYQLGIKVHQFSMPTEDQIIVPMHGHNRILRIDLRLQTKNIIPFIFLAENSLKNFKTFVFNYSLMICFAENLSNTLPTKTATSENMKGYIGYRVRLTYLSIPLTESEPIVYEEERIMRQKYTGYYKVDNHSSIAMCRVKIVGDFQFQLYIHNIVSKQSNLRKFSFGQGNIKPNNLYWMSDMFEVQKDQIYIFTNSSKSERQSVIVADLKSQTLSQISLNLPYPFAFLSKICFMDQIMVAYKGEEEIKKQLFIPLMELISNKQISNKQIEKNKKLIFIENSSKKIIKTKEVEEKLQHLNVNVCQYDARLLFHWSIFNSRLTIHKYRNCILNEFYLQLLLHLNQDFDDDLLQDAIEMLEIT